MPFYTAEKNFQLKQNDRYSETIAKCPEKDVKKRLFQRIFELEFMFRSDCHDPIKNFFKQCFEYFRITAVHCFRKRGFCHGFHAKAIKPFVVGKQSVFNFPQRILAGNLSKEQSQKLFPCGEMLAISVSA